MGSFTFPDIDTISKGPTDFSVSSEKQMRSLFPNLPVSRSYLGKCSPILPSSSALRQRGMQCLCVLATSPTGSPERSHCRLEPCHAASPGLCRSASDLERRHRTPLNTSHFNSLLFTNVKPSLTLFLCSAIPLLGEMSRYSEVKNHGQIHQFIAHEAILSKCNLSYVC